MAGTEAWDLITELGWKLPFIWFNSCIFGVSQSRWIPCFSHVHFFSKCAGWPGWSREPITSDPHSVGPSVEFRLSLRLRGLNFCEAMDHWSNFDRGEPNETSKPNRRKRGENHMNHQLCEERLVASICIFPLTPGFYSDAVLGDGNEEEVSRPASPLEFVLGMNSFDLNEVLDFWFLENQMKPWEDPAWMIQASSRCFFLDSSHEMLQFFGFGWVLIQVIWYNFVSLSSQEK